MNDKDFLSYVETVMSDENAVGLAAAAVDKNGNILYKHFFGYRDKEKQLPVDENTIFGVASLTKSFTAVAIMQLEEEGKISLDAPVSDYLPELTFKNRTFPVKVKDFLMHAGGYFPLHRTTIYEMCEKLGIKDPYKEDLAYSEDFAVESTKIIAEQMDAQGRLLCEPGGFMSYCNDGFGLLSEIIRRCGDCDSFPEYLKKHILDPLLMDRTCADYLTPLKDDNASVLYSVENEKERADHDYYHWAFALGGTGALKSTVSDMCKYVKMLINKGIGGNGKRIATEQMIEEMVRYRQYNGPDSFYGYGLESTDVDGTLCFGHGGSLPGVSSYMMFSHENEKGIIILCNTEDVTVKPIAENLMRIINGRAVKTELKEYEETDWDEETKKAAAGDYVKDEGGEFSLLLDANGELIFSSKGRRIKPVMISEDELIVKDKYTDIFIRILKDDKGNVRAARYGSRVYYKL